MLKKSLLIGGLFFSSIAMANPNLTTGNASTMHYDLLNLSATVSKKVENNQIDATLSKVVQHKNTTDIANQLNQTINQALVIAKKYPQVKVTTGYQTTYPRYDKNQKIIGWTGKASLNLNSTDTVATSKLIAELQDSMKIDDLNFSLSDEARKQIEEQLLVDVSKSFQSQAKNLLPVWQAKNYRLVNVSFRRQSDNYAMPMYAARSIEVAAEASSVTEQNFQVGTSTISVTADGTIQLVK